MQGPIYNLAFTLRQAIAAVCKHDRCVTANLLIMDDHQCIQYPDASTIPNLQEKPNIIALSVSHGETKINIHFSAKEKEKSDAIIRDFCLFVLSMGIFKADQFLNASLLESEITVQ